MPRINDGETAVFEGKSVGLSVGVCVEFATVGNIVGTVGGDAG